MHNRWNLINYREQHIAVRRAVVIAQMNATRAQNYAPQDSTRHVVIPQPAPLSDAGLQRWINL